MTDTRMCPYCAEDVRIEAIKCKHCGSYLATRGAPSDWHRSTRDRMVAGVCGGAYPQRMLICFAVLLAEMVVDIHL